MLCSSVAESHARAQETAQLPPPATTRRLACRVVLPEHEPPLQATPPSVEKWRSKESSTLSIREDN